MTGDRSLADAEQRRHIGLIGGTFDPIHNAHLAIAEEVRAALQLQKMVFIPAGLPPHKANRGNTAIRHRVAMVRLAIATNPHFTISLAEVDRPGPSFLVETLHILHAQWGPNTALSFVIGWDSLQELPDWYDAPGILAQLTHLIAVGRPGYVEDQHMDKLERRLPGLRERLRIVDVPQLAISSTDLRRRVAEGRPITYLTPYAVERYIIEHGLYQTQQTQHTER